MEIEQLVKQAKELCLEFAEMSEQRNEEYEKLEQHRREVTKLEEELQEQMKLLGLQGVEDEDMRLLHERRKAKEQAAEIVKKAREETEEIIKDIP